MHSWAERLPWLSLLTHSLTSPWLSSSSVEGDQRCKLPLPFQQVAVLKGFTTTYCSVPHHPREKSKLRVRGL